MRFTAVLVRCSIVGFLAGPACHAEGGAPSPEADLFEVLKNKVGPIKIKGKAPEEAKKEAEQRALQMMRGEKGPFVCKACQQPYYKHVDGFECKPQGPINPATGEPASALQIEEVQATCPVCNATFSAALTGNQNARNGQDRDFCVHSLGKYAVHSTVWVCPDCGYASFANKKEKQNRSSEVFSQGLDGQPVGPETIKLVKEKLTPAIKSHLSRIANLNQEKASPELLRFSAYMKQTDIPDWIKFEHATLLAEKLRARMAPSILAKLHIEAAYACRRAVCDEIGISGLNQDLQESMGKSIRRMSVQILAECLSIRRQLKDEFLDPTKPETDPAVLEQAVSNILEAAKRVVHQRPREGSAAAANDQSMLNTGDIYALRIRHAGFLDRLGRIPEAIKTLEEARAAVRGGPEVDREQAVQRYLEKQLDLLRSAAEERIATLKLEREHLYRGADELMRALYYSPDLALMEPALNCYWAGELFRRDGREPEVARACFEAARTLLQTPEKDPRKESNRVLLMSWNADQLALLSEKSKGKTVRKNISESLAKVLEFAPAGRSGGTHSAGPSLQASPAAQAAPPERVPELPRDTATVTPPPSSPATPAVGANPPVLKESAPEKPIPPAASKGSPNARAELLKRYYVALTKYQKEKKANAGSLGDLVAGNYLLAEDASLDEAGSCILCPETRGKLMYSQKAVLGDASATLIFPLRSDTNRLRLFGDGRMGE